MIISLILISGLLLMLIMLVLVITQKKEVLRKMSPAEEVQYEIDKIETNE